MCYLKRGLHFTKIAGNHLLKMGVPDHLPVQHLLKHILRKVDEVRKSV